MLGTMRRWICRNRSETKSWTCSKRWRQRRLQNYGSHADLSSSRRLELHDAVCSGSEHVSSPTKCGRRHQTESAERRHSHEAVHNPPWQRTDNDDLEMIEQRIRMNRHRHSLRSTLGLTDVHNLLPARVVEQKSVAAMQHELQCLLKFRAVNSEDGWQHTFSPRVSLSEHPLHHFS